MRRTAGPEDRLLYTLPVTRYTKIVLLTFEQSADSRIFLLTSHATADELLSGAFGSNLGCGNDAIYVLHDGDGDNDDGCRGDRRGGGGGGFYATVRVISTAAKNGGHGDGEQRRDGDVTTAVAAVVAGGDEPVILMSHTVARPRPAKLLLGATAAIA